MFKHGSAPPKELYLAWHCERWNALPHAGGIMDQPAGLLDKMAYAQNVYNVIKSYERVTVQGMSQWVTDNPDAWALIVRLNDW